MEDPFNILVLYPISSDAIEVVLDPQNVADAVPVSSDTLEVVLEQPNVADAVPVSSDTLVIVNAIESPHSALCLNLDRQPKSGKGYMIGRGSEADIRLKDIRSSKSHCLIFIDEEGKPILNEQSTNGIYIDGKRINNVVMELTGGMKITILESEFLVIIPWREDQEGYETKASRIMYDKAQNGRD